MRKYGWFFSIKSGRKLELWLYAMTFSRTDDETQIRLSSWIKYKGKNLKLLFFFTWQVDCKTEKKSFALFPCSKLCCQDLIAGTKPHDCSQDECPLRTEKTNRHDSAGKNMLPEELKREIKALNILVLKSDMMNLSKKCFYFSLF